jgi:uncharacterized coiled-coil protein SlyX
MDNTTENIIKTITRILYKYPSLNEINFIEKLEIINKKINEENLFLNNNNNELEDKYKYCKITNSKYYYKNLELKEQIKYYTDIISIIKIKYKKELDINKLLTNNIKTLESKIDSQNEIIKQLSNNIEENTTLKKELDINKQLSNNVEILENKITSQNETIKQLSNNVEILENKITSQNETIKQLSINVDSSEKKIKIVLDKNIILKNEIEKIKMENIELELVIRKYKKNKIHNTDNITDTNYINDTEYTDDTDDTNDTDNTDDTDYTDDTYVEPNNTKYFIKHKTLKQKTAFDFFDREIEKAKEKELEGHNTKYDEIRQTYNNIDYNTDYRVDLLHNSSKLKQKEQRKYYNDRQYKPDEIDIKPDEIDIKPAEIDIKPDEIDIKPAEIDIKPAEIKKVRIDNSIIIQEAKNEIQNNKIIIGGSNKNKQYELYDIEGDIKMCIKNELTTLTEQDINRNDIQAIKKIYSRKTTRRHRANKK